jgi:hypothetical protein
MASPIQILLNPENFEEARDTGGGGPKKDFFSERDAAFRAHKKALLSQLDAVATALARQPQGNVGFIKVILRREAWAKSHRPIRSLFRSDRILLVGGGDLGEMYFEARPRLLHSIAQDISAAEEVTRLRPNPNTGRMVPHPSTAKSETGAIERRDRTDRALWSWRSPSVLGGRGSQLASVPSQKFLVICIGP